MKILLLTCFLSVAMGIEWTWSNGASTPNSAGNYGSLGVGSADNVPSAREDGVSWNHPLGLLLYGGYGVDSTGSKGILNDLWFMNFADNRWVWIGGPNSKDQHGTYDSSANAYPGARYGATSFELDGEYYLFGGYGLTDNVTFGELNDLWKLSFDGTTALWTWISGSTEVNRITESSVFGASGMPSGRHGSVGWAHSNCLFLFGGLGLDDTPLTSNIQTKVYLNDLWKFNLATKQWIWSAGSIKGNQVGVYNGGIGTNYPGGRYEAVGWLDAQNAMWLFSGKGLGTTTTPTLLNDMWVVSAEGSWVWISGNATGSQYAKYGGLHYNNVGEIIENSPDTFPGSQRSSFVWRLDNYVYMLSGEGYSTDGNSGKLVDLWEYGTITLDWVTVAGPKTINFEGQYGDFNWPGARNNAFSWTDINGTLYVFGGNGFAPSGSIGELNDFWVFTLGNHTGHPQINETITSSTSGTNPTSSTSTVATSTTDGNIASTGASDQVATATTSADHNSRTEIVFVVGITAGILSAVLIVVILSIVIYIKRKQSGAYNKLDAQQEESDSVPLHEIHEPHDSNVFTIEDEEHTTDANDK